MIPKLHPHKPGDTFSYAGTCKLPVGVWVATCQLRGALLLTPVANIDVQLGVVTVTGDTPIALSATASATLLWLPGVYELDIRFADASGAVIHSATVQVPVIPAITRV